MHLTREDFLGRADHSLLRPDLTLDEIVAGLEFAAEVLPKAVCISPHRLGYAADILAGTGVVIATVAALCIYPDMVAVAAEALAGSGVGIASVATAFPTGRTSIEVRLADTAVAVAAGATEIDMVIDRGAFLSGHYGKVFDDIVRVKQACGGARLKVILETGELATYDNVRRASWLALLAGGDFIKTSTGKISPAATLPVTHVMLQAVRDWYEQTGERRAVKPAGGIRNTKDAIRYLVAVKEVAGPEWLDPFLFRFGASSLLNDLLMQRRTQLEGHYSGPDYVTVD